MANLSLAEEVEPKRSKFRAFKVPSVEIRSTATELAGITLFSAGFGWFSPGLGMITGGIGLIVVGLALSRPGDDG